MFERVARYPSSFAMYQIKAFQPPGAGHAREEEEGLAEGRNSSARMLQGEWMLQLRQLAVQVALMGKLQARNIVQFLGIFMLDAKAMLVTE